MKKNGFWTIPNLMSCLRLCLIPVFVILYHNGQTLAAFAVLCASAVTDVTDGIVARRFNMVSDVGKILDPIADKLTQGAVLICLAARQPIIWALVGLMFVKEAVTGIANWVIIRRTGWVHAARWHGKLATVLLYTAMLSHLLWPDMPQAASLALIGVCAAAVLLSLCLYGKRNLETLRTGKVDPPGPEARR